MTPEQQRICVEISTAQEPSPETDASPWVVALNQAVGQVTYSKGGWWIAQSNGQHIYWIPLPYFTSEEASAKLLEAMPFPRLLQYGEPKKWECAFNFNDYPSHHPDRKTAIVLAFVKFMATGGK